MNLTSNPTTSSESPAGSELYINISAYKFVHLDELTVRRQALLDLCNSLQLKGTILLSDEGINIFVAGLRPNIDRLVEYFETKPEYNDLPIKESESDDQPFTRMLVRIKKEIIAFGIEGIDPSQRTSPKLKPADLKRWLDEGRELTLLDVRNDYEVEIGTFSEAKAIGVDHFRNFPEKVRQLPPEMKDETIVMFCTGGIRCEKAGPFMEREGFTNVYQLDGGILKYFEDCGGEHYDGECFVFDKRVAVDPALQETATEQCYACQHPLTADDQTSEKYVPGESCPFCFREPQEQMQEKISQTDLRIQQQLTPLPGSQPYDNHRPMNVPLRFDGMNMVEFLLAYHPHVDSGYWQSEVNSGKILYKNEPVTPDAEVWAGQRLVHLLAGSVEPPVATDIRVIHEDDVLVVVNKPAPLAMHPCGRFNRNTLSYILNAVFEGEKIRMTHRLDANTTGVVVFTRKRAAAQKIQAQFENNRVEKTYLARVIGRPTSTSFECHAAISSRPQTGGLRELDTEGLEAHTRFELAGEFDDGTSLIRCFPQTGRTNQIRIHLWSMGTPIVNDPSYLPNLQLGSNTTLDLAQPPLGLHAWKLKLVHPETEEPIEFTSPPPSWSTLPTVRQ